ncbi:MAG: 50S ribosomal protein L35 [Nitrospiria bacterium]
MKTKLKTHRGAAKRFKISGSGKMMMRRAGKRHLLTHKSTRRKRGHALPVEVNKSELQGIRRLLPYL